MKLTYAPVYMSPTLKHKYPVSHFVREHHLSVTDRLHVNPCSDLLPQVTLQSRLVVYEMLGDVCSQYLPGSFEQNAMATYDYVVNI